MKKTPCFRKNALHRALRVTLLSLVSTSMTISHAGLAISQSPPVQTNKEPVPNIILTLDDSGSMQDWVDKDTTGSWPPNPPVPAASQRITGLKDAASQAFSAYGKGEFRLAYQKLSEGKSFPISEPARLMKPYEGKHKTDFLNWLSAITPNGGTPLREAVIKAGLYTMGNVDIEPVADGVLNYWNGPRYTTVKFTSINKKPGASDLTYTYDQKTFTYDPLEGLSCLRTVHVLMTDGAWGGGTYVGNSSTVAQHGALLQDASLKVTDSQEPCNGTDTGVVNMPHLQGGSNSTGSYSQAIARQNSGNLYSDVSYTSNYALRLNGETPSPTIYPLKTVSGTSPCTRRHSLADVVFNFWATDLRPDLANGIKPIIKKSGSEIFSFNNGSNYKDVPEWWNPKNNPASWQNMQTYTIGFGPVASLREINSSDPKDYMYVGNFFNKLITGADSWSVRFECDAGGGACYDGFSYDLWHAAYNGRGKFYAATTNDALVKAFDDILSNIVSDSKSAAVVTGTGSTSRLLSDSLAYLASYDAKNNNWRGSIAFWNLNQLGLPPPAKPVQDAKIQKSSRVMLTAVESSTAPNDPPIGRAFTKIEIEKSGYQLSTFGLDTIKVNTAMRDNEQLGDIVHSGLELVGKASGNYTARADYRNFAKAVKNRVPMLYVGANDGMLHGFNANPNSGVEKLAYIPRGILPELKDYLATPYVHRYFVDGTPFSGDAQIAAAAEPTYNGWRTVLVGTLGAGGKGYFVLDVTNPASFSELNAANTVLVDNTKGTDPDIGHSVGEPSFAMTNVSRSAQIVQINVDSTVNQNNKQWAVIMGNGYNSTNGKPVLLVQTLEGSKKLYKVDACKKSASNCDATPSTVSNDTNGLSTPMPVDLNSDGTADVVYAGDLKGNMWKFDISSDDPSDWKVALGETKLFQAKGIPLQSGGSYAGLNREYKQAITSSPLVVPHPKGGMMVLFGTGRNITDADNKDNDANSVTANGGNKVNTIYGIHDAEGYYFDTVAKVVKLTGGSGVDSTLRDPSIGSRYIELTMQNSPKIVWNGTNNISASTSSNNKIDATKKGWYIDIPDVQLDNAAKVLLAPMLRYGNVVQFFTTNVANESSTGTGAGSSNTCSANTAYNSAKWQLRFFNLFSGANSNIPVSMRRADGSTVIIWDNIFQIDGIPITTDNSTKTNTGEDSKQDLSALPGGRTTGWRIIR